MSEAKELPVFFLDPAGKELGKTTVPGTWHIEMTLAGKIPEGTEKIDVKLENGDVFRIIHGGRDQIIIALRSAGTGKEGNFNYNTQGDDRTTRYMLFPENSLVLRVPMPTLYDHRQ